MSCPAFRTCNLNATGSHQEGGFRVDITFVAILADQPRKFANAVQQNIEPLPSLCGKISDDLEQVDKPEHSGHLHTEVKASSMSVQDSWMTQFEMESIRYRNFLASHNDRE